VICNIILIPVRCNLALFHEVDFAGVNADQLAQVYAVAQMSPGMQVGVFALGKKLFGEAMDVR